MNIVQSLPRWLPFTCPWLYNQVVFLPDGIVTSVVCESLENADRFPHPRVYPLIPEHKVSSYAARIARRAGIRQYVPHAIRASRKAGADVLHSHWGDQGWRDLPIAFELGIPQVVQFYGKDVGYLPAQNATWRERYAEMFERVSLVLCEGPHMAEAIVALGCPDEKVEVQRLGVEVERIPVVPRQRSRDDPFRVLIAASFREKKGIPDALAAVGELRNTGIDVRTTVIGDASEDPRSIREARVIHDTVERYSLRGATRFLGYTSRERMFEEAFQHHVFLSPSRTAADGDTEGGAPVALIDVAATGMPIVSTTHCDIPSVVRHGVSGYLAQEGNVPQLVAHLRSLAEDPERGQVMGMQARCHIEEAFDAETLARQLARRYERLVA